LPTILKLSSMPPEKDRIVRKRTLQKDKYELKNLKFLGDFMTATGLTTTAAGEKIGLSQVSIYYWLKKDDAHLSTVSKLIEACGFKLTIEYAPLENAEPQRTEIVIEVPREKRLSFLSDALSSVDKEYVSRELGIGLSTIYYWFDHDDIFISYIYRIAEIIGMRVKVTIRPQSV